MNNNDPTQQKTSKTPANSGFTGDSYELIDFGNGRKLENFAGLTLDRPCPAAEGSKRTSVSSWESADLVFRNDPKSGWTSSEVQPGWIFRWNDIAMELRTCPFGHVGLFPEQIANWRWMRSLAEAKNRPVNSFKALNLFGYTGGSSLALAAAGWQVTHVDASRPTVLWARKNAQLSNLESAPIRWIVDDVRDFVSREAKREEKYDLVLMDPPAYGHGADGKGWTLERDLEALIEICIRILRPMASILVTGHSPIPSLKQGPFTDRTWKKFQATFSKSSSHQVSLMDNSRRKLDFGYAYRFWN